MGWQNGDGKKNKKKKTKSSPSSLGIYLKNYPKNQLLLPFLSKIIETQFHLNFHSENTIKYKFPPF